MPKRSHSTRTSAERSRQSTVSASDADADTGSESLPIYTSPPPPHSGNRQPQHPLHTCILLAYNAHSSLLSSPRHPPLQSAHQPFHARPPRRTSSHNHSPPRTHRIASAPLLPHAQPPFPSFRRSSTALPPVRSTAPSVSVRGTQTQHSHPLTICITNTAENQEPYVFTSATSHVCATTAISSPFFHSANSKLKAFHTHGLGLLLFPRISLRCLRRNAQGWHSHVLQCSRSLLLNAPMCAPYRLLI